MEQGKVPDTIDQYRVLRPLGRGGSGQVYQVADPTSGEHLALKWLQVRGLAEDRFNREYEASIRLNHPNIVRVYHCGRHDDTPWFTMELVDGIQAQKHVQQIGEPGGEARTKEVLRVAYSVADALHYIHQRGLVHRDLKSSNVMVLPDGRVKLLDFGSACVLDADRITIDGEFVGTYAYASPEQLMGLPSDRRSDLYCFGVLLYRLLSGKRPFLAEDPAELSRLHVEEPPPSLMDLVPNIAPELEALVMECLEKAPQDRPSSAGRIMKRLKTLAPKDLGLPGTLKLDRSAVQLVGREQQFARVSRFLDQGKPGSVCVTEVENGAGGDAFLQAMETKIRTMEWWFYSCDMSKGLDMYQLALMLRQIGTTFQGTPPAQAARAIEVIGHLCRGWGTANISHQDAMITCGKALFQERYLVDGRPILIQISYPSAKSAAFWRTLARWAQAMVKEQVPVLFSVAIHARPKLDIESLTKELPSSRTILLGALDEWQTGLLVGSLLHRRPPPPSATRKIFEVSGGFPEFIEVVIENLVADGLLETCRDSSRLQWGTQGELEVRLAESLDVGLERELMRLSAFARRILEVLALSKMRLSEHEMASCLAWSREDLKPLLVELESAGWIYRGGDLGWTMSNLLYRRMVTQNVHPLRKGVHQRRIVHVLEGREPSIGLVHALLDTGQVERALPLAVDLAEEELVHERSGSALAILQPLMKHKEMLKTLPNPDVGRLFLVCSKSLAQVNPTDPRLQDFLRYLADWTENPVLAAGIAEVKAGIQKWLGHYPNYRKILGDAWGALDSPIEPLLGSSLARQLGESHSLNGEFGTASKWFDLARDYAEKVDSDIHWADAEVGKAGIFYAAGQLQSAEYSASRALEMFDDAGHLPGMGKVLPIWADTLRLQGRFTQALDVLNEAAPMLRAAESPVYYLRTLISTARCEMNLGRLGRAQECLDEFDAVLRSGEYLELRIHVALVRGALQIQSGQARRASELMAEVLHKSAAAGLLIEAEVARAMMAEVLWRDEPKTSDKYFEMARAKLTEIGHIPALMETCIRFAYVSRSMMRPDLVFAPLKNIAAEQPLEQLRLEWAIADALYTEEKGWDARSQWNNALTSLRWIAENLNEKDRMAIQLHPWSRIIRAGLSRVGGP